jgi:hypothetical protein
MTAQPVARSRPASFFERSTFFSGVHVDHAAWVKMSTMWRQARLADTASADRAPLALQMRFCTLVV